jgi:hypothetical protein
MEMKLAEYEKEFAKHEKFKREMEEFKEATEKHIQHLEIQASYAPIRELLGEMLEDTEEARNDCEKITGGRDAVLKLKRRFDKLYFEKGYCFSINDFKK